MPINSGDTAWILTASALVMLMTPGVALFYGGMVRRKNVLSTLMMICPKRCTSSLTAPVPAIWAMARYLSCLWKTRFVSGPAK